MSRVEEEKEAQRVAERLLQQKRLHEDKTRQLKEGESSFSKLMQQQRAHEHHGQHVSQEQKRSVGKQVLGQLQKEARARQEGHQGELGRQVQRQSGLSQEESLHESQRTEGAHLAEGHAVDAGHAAHTSEARKADAKSYREALEERVESLRSGSSEPGAQAGGDKGDLSTDADGGQGSKQGGGDGKDKKEGGAEAAAALRFNPALMAPAPLAQPRNTAQSERLRRMATEIAEKIVERVRVGTNAAGLAEFQIDLRSNVLSGLSIKLSAKNGRIQAVFSGRNTEVLKQLEQHSDELKKALSSRGLTLERLRIEAKT